MIISIDCETHGLEATRSSFIIGGILTEKGQYYEYRRPEEMWDKILEIGEKERKQGKNLVVYGHNIRYDYYTIYDREDKECKIYSTRPFIIDRKNIKFTDTMALYKKLSLEKVGELIGLKKGQTPEKLKDPKSEITERDIQQIRPYLKRDCEITLKGVQYFKKKMQENGIRVRTLISIGQIAIKYATNQIRKITNAEGLLDERNEIGKYHETRHKEEIHNAYRGGRVQALAYGLIKNVNYADINSLYPLAATKIRMPDLRTEIRIEKPNKEILKNIGVSKATIKSPDFRKLKKIPFLPIRIKGENEYLETPKTMTGTWTNGELLKASKIGYKIQNIEWSIIYEEQKENPFKKIMKELYEARKKTGNDFDNYFYKSIMNNIIGKYAQTNTIKEEKIANVEEYGKLTKEGWTVNEELELDSEYLYEKTIRKEHPKWYAPIIAALITAKAREILYDQITKLPKEQVYYLDTDSVVYMNTPQNDEKFKYGKELGEYKKEQEAKDIYIYGRKGYMIDDQIRLSGISKIDLTKESFLKGTITYRKMITEKSAKNKEDIGKFKSATINLIETMKEHREKLEELEEQEIVIDDKEEGKFDYSYI